MLSSVEVLSLQLWRRREPDGGGNNDQLQDPGKSDVVNMEVAAFCESRSIAGMLASTRPHPQKHHRHKHGMRVKSCAESCRRCQAPNIEVGFEYDQNHLHIPRVCAGKKSTWVMSILLRRSMKRRVVKSACCLVSPFECVSLVEGTGWQCRPSIEESSIHEVQEIPEAFDSRMLCSMVEEPNKKSDTCLDR